MRLSLLLLIALLSTTAFGQSRLQARRHFQKGMQLIARGAYDAGVAELEQAYAIKPHPNVAYNIAKAHVEAGHVRDAIDAFNRYLSFKPPDAEEVRDQIAALEKKLPKKQTVPDKAFEEALKPIETPPPRESVDPQLMARLTELADRMESTLNRLENQEARAQQTPLVSPAAVPEESADQGAVPYEETVAIASRRQQSSLEAPNSTTVITAEEIRASGATNLVELFRRVPGAEVMQLGVGSANVSFRGFNQRLANKVLVLLDGRTEYQDFIGLTLWPAIPVGLEEIERIEIIRGPGSALYGANAMLGVINIITRQGGNSPPGEVTAILGSGDTAGGSFIASNAAGKLRYRASVGYIQTDKWSRDFPDDRPDIASQSFDSTLGLRSVRGNLSTRLLVSSSVNVGVAAGVNRLYTEIYPLGLLRNFYLDGIGGYVHADATLGPLRTRLFWNTLNATAGPQYEARGTRSLRTDVSSNVFYGELLFSRDFELGGAHHLDVGVAGRLKRVGWGYLDQFRQQLHGAAFVQDEWRILEQLRLIGSYRVDRNPLLDRGQPGYAQSPRVSAMFFPVEGHALRASFATAFREPTFLESYTAVRVPLPGVNGASALTTGDQTLKPEQLTAVELGYRGSLPATGVELDVALYRNEVRNLITLSALTPISANEAFDPQTQTYILGRSRFFNETAVYQALGAEVGATLAPVDRLEVRSSVALQRISSAETPCAPCSQAPAVKLFGGATYRSAAGVDVTVEASWISATTWIEREPAATDPTRIDAKSNPLAAYAVINARLGYRLLKDTLTVAVQGTQLGPPHREHPFGNQIERRAFVTVGYTP